VRAREVLDEDYNTNLESDLTNLLVRAKGTGQSEIKTRNLVSQLQQMGYSVSIASIENILSNNPAVVNISPGTITLTPSAGYDSANAKVDRQEDSADHVRDMAMAAVDKKNSR
jgi:hypothetical protein